MQRLTGRNRLHTFAVSLEVVSPRSCHGQSGMLIVSLLSDMRWNLLRQASPTGARQMRVPDAVAMVDALALHPRSYAVVDPSLMGETDFLAVATAAAEMAVPLVLLGELTVRTTKAYLRAEAVRPTDAQFGSINSISRDWLRFILDGSAEADVPAMILHRVNVAVRRLPVRIQEYTAGLFAGAAIVPSTQAFSEAMGMSRKSIQRWHARVGLAPPPMCGLHSAFGSNMAAVAIKPHFAAQSQSTRWFRFGPHLRTPVPSLRALCTGQNT